MNKNLILYFLIALIFGLLKLFYTQSGNDGVLCLLRPTNYCIEWLTNSTAIYRNESGFYHEKLNIVIEKSCSGFTFFLLCFLMSSVAILPHLKTNAQRFFLLPFALSLAYFSTIFVNTSRIFIALKMRYFDLSFISKNKAVLHEAEGVFVYLSFFILLHILIQFFIKNQPKYQ